MINYSASTLMAYGGTYANNVEIKVENFLPFAFPFVIGDPKMKQRVKVSLEVCIQMYMQRLLQQFIEGPTILVMNHIYNRKMLYKSGVMTCRSSVDGVQLGEKLFILSMENLEQLDDNNADRLDAAAKGLLKAISKSCRAMGHTKEAAKYAR